MAIYTQAFDVEFKADQSPVTEADIAAHHALIEALTQLTPEIPVLSEESEAPEYATRHAWQRYWLIDPLDGTKSFIQRTGEFTVNVALIESGTPVFGIVQAPALNTLWWGSLTGGAWKRDDHSNTARITCRPLPCPATTEHPWRIVGSKSHGREQLAAFCQTLPTHEMLNLGSSLKLCMIAEGQADIYPRLAPTSEWDTAAAHAILLAAGGNVFELSTLTPLRYNQTPSLLNPYFIACHTLTEKLIPLIKAAFSER